MKNILNSFKFLCIILIHIFHLNKARYNRNIKLGCIKVCPPLWWTRLSVIKPHFLLWIYKNILFLINKKVIKCSIKMSFHIILIFADWNFICISHKKTKKTFHCKVSILTYDKHSVSSCLLNSISYNRCINRIKMITCYNSS